MIELYINVFVLKREIKDKKKKKKKKTKLTKFFLDRAMLFDHHGKDQS
jgi:hypothetical protein